MGARVDVQHPAVAMGAAVRTVRRRLPSFAGWQLKALQLGLGCARWVALVVHCMPTNLRLNGIFGTLLRLAPN